MGLGDMFKINQFKVELEQLKAENTRLYNDNCNMHAMLTPEMQNVQHIQTLINNLEFKKTVLQNDIAKIEQDIRQRVYNIQNLDNEIKKRQSQIISLDEDILVQEFGLYKPHFCFANALDYKEKLARIRSEQKDLIKNNCAVLGNNNWQVNGSYVKGKKLVSDTQKLLLRAFNSECDELVSKIKYTNFDSSLNRIYKSADTISKLGAVMNISISPSYLELKVKELRLAFEYQQKKQEEKEEKRIARSELREAEKVQREIEIQRRIMEKEQSHYMKAYEDICQQLKKSPLDSALIVKKKLHETHLADIMKKLQDLDYREANYKAGYVYIISNIGSFGKDIYKIGMTRRLEPQDRVDELGGASVPFKFDVHAMIFSDDAPALEAALHKAFENRKLNLVNTRREFFNVTLDEIKEVVRKNFDKTVEFVDVPDAEQYRISQKMKQNH